MSRPPIGPLSVGATASECLLVLQQRLLEAEGQTDTLLQELHSIELSGKEPVGGTSAAPRLPTPLKVLHTLGLGARDEEGQLWRQCEVLVGRVCRLESLLHTLKLTVFRLETDRELNPSHIARLREQLSSLQEQCEQEQLSSRREVMRLRDQLHEVCEERDEAQREANRLQHELELSHRAHMDVAVTADKLKKVRVQMSQKLQQAKEELTQERAARLEFETSQSALLRRMEETEGVVQREREQVKLLQADCHALQLDGQQVRAELQEKEELIQELLSESEKLRDQSEGKETAILEMANELKRVRVALQTQQQGTSKLIREDEDLRTAADKVQRLNDQLEVQCSDLSSALRSLSEENSQLQINLKMEQERVAQRLKEHDQLLDAAKKNILSELEGSMTERLMLKKELETLKTDHVKLKQSSAVALETAVTHQDLLERTLERLRGELSCAVNERELMLKERDEARTEITTAVSKLEAERNSLASRLAELQVELSETSSALQKQQQENRGMMARQAAVQHQQQSNESLRTELRNKGQEVHTLWRERLQGLRDIQEVKEEVENLHSLLTRSTHEQVSALRDELDQDRLDNRKLSQSLEQALLSHQATQEKLRQSQQQLHKTLSEREVELHDAKEAIGRLTEQVDALGQQLLREKDCGRKTAQRETSELKTALNDALTRSDELSRENRELREKRRELEKLVNSQKSHIKAQQSQIRQHLDNKATLNNSQRIKNLEEEIQNLESSKNEYERICYEQSQSLLQVRSDLASLQDELQSLSSSQQGKLQAERTLVHQLKQKCKMLEECAAKLREERNETELKMMEVSQESQQISENLQEAHTWFRSKFDRLNSEGKSNRAELCERTEDSVGSGKQSAPDSPAQDASKVVMCVAEPELERWASTLQRWETKKELARIAGHYKPTAKTHSLP